MEPVKTNSYIHKQLINSKDNTPLAKTNYTITLSNDTSIVEDTRVLKGTTDENGYTEKHTIPTPLPSEIRIAADIRSIGGRDGSLYSRHESYAEITTQQPDWQTSSVSINSEQWNGWVFQRECTAIAETEASLKELAELVTGDSRKWKWIGGYSGDPETVPRGQTVDYIDLTSPIQTRILIVSGSSHDRPDVDEYISSHLQTAMLILHPQSVPMRFKCKIYRTENTTVNGLPLLEIPFEIDDASAKDSLYDMTVIAEISSTKILGSDEIIGLYDPSGRTLVQFYTDYFYDRDTNIIYEGASHAFIDNLPTMLISKGFSDSTIAHELCHIFGLQHSTNIHNLMYPNDGRLSNDLNLSQTARIKKWFRDYFETDSLRIRLWSEKIVDILDVYGGNNISKERLSFFKTEDKAASNEQLYK